jgi:hypothetical protein
MASETEHTPCSGQLSCKRVTAMFQEVKMDVPVTEEQIRTLAFYFWEKDGGPEGHSEEYWEKARRQLLADASPAASEGETAQ